MRLDPSDFIKKPATHIVSIGDACNVAYNLRRHFDFDGAFPFDWWVTKGDALERFLTEPSVHRLYDVERLELTSDGASVRHRDYGILLHHEFPRDWGKPGNPVKTEWADYLDNPRARTAALLEKLQSLDSGSNRIAFVRHNELSGRAVELLGSMFSSATWTVIALSGLSTPGSGWKNDPAIWDVALSASGLSLDRTNHRPFVEKTPERD